MNRVKTDVLIIGAGAAGCVTALAAAEAGAHATLILNSSDFLESNTGQAQGGIIYRGKGDKPALLEKDILAAGAGKCDRRAVRWLAQRGPALVKKLLIDQVRVPFDRDARGNLDITREAAHGIARIIHAEDLTGRAIELSLYQAVARSRNITIVTGATAVDLLTLSHHSLVPTDVYEPPTCIGAYVLLQNEKRVVPFLAKETVLATGGLGQLFLHTTNPKRARGDGIAMAYRAGARIINLEYVQFHPTALYHSGGERFLISESVRGEGGVLVRTNGSTFMERFHPKKSLAPRDVVARAIHTVMLEYDEPCVYLDITHKKPEWTKKRFPNIYKKCLELGIDITQQPIPVVPAAHYACGGVAVDLKGRSSMRRLRAIGEVSCTGLHGANRLASTSLLEAILWGWTAGADIAQNVKPGRRGDRGDYYFPRIPDWAHVKEQVDPALILQDWMTIKYTMWNYVGLMRSTKRMKRARQILRLLQLEIGDFYEKAKLTDDLLGLRNGVQTALAVLFAAMENHESRGCHYRID